jgi:hypothetical protein
MNGQGDSLFSINPGVGFTSKTMVLEDFYSRCFLCGREEPTFNSEARICACVHRQGFPESELPCYVSLLPGLRDYSVRHLPSLWKARPSDVLAVATGDLGLSQDAIARQIEAVDERCNMRPYQIDLLNTSHHLRCGNSMVYRSSSLEDMTGSELVLVLDMGTYYWSGTLKDPRSWAILNTALTSHITDLAVWTAGNAGISLAKLAYFANRRLPPESRLQIHAIVDDDIGPEIRRQLRLWQCEVLDLFRQDKPVLNPSEIRALVAARLRCSRRRLEDSSYWHVTDGWDGVGLLMYRLIAAQVIRDLCGVLNDEQAGPLDIVVPVGTGDLLLGFYLGLKDCEEAGVIRYGACRLVGVLPSGANILHNVRQRGIPTPINPGGGLNVSPSAPLMPKLKSLYTPLAPCLAQIEKEGMTEFVVVTAADQLRASRQVFSGGIDDGIVAEPSALATFAALPYLNNSSRCGNSDNRRVYQSNRRNLVVNSGLGVLGRAEEDLLHRAMRI